MRNVVALCRGRLAFFGQVVFIEIAAFHGCCVPRPIRPETRSFATGLAIA
jgi:hypothetical protein